MSRQENPGARLTCLIRQSHSAVSDAAWNLFSGTKLSRAERRHVMSLLHAALKQEDSVRNLTHRLCALETEQAALHTMLAQWEYQRDKGEEE